MFVQIQGQTFNTTQIQRINTTDCENAFRIVITIGGIDSVLTFPNRGERDSVANKLYVELEVHTYRVRQPEIIVEQKKDDD